MTQEVQSQAEIEEHESSRRSLLGKGAVAAAVATVAGLAMAKQTLAGAANDTPLHQGAANTGATLSTTLAGGGTFYVADGKTLPNPVLAGMVGKASIWGSQSNSLDVGVLGSCTATNGGAGVQGYYAGSSGVGVRGTSVALSSIGVLGEHLSTSAGSGVVGTSLNGPGVVGTGTSADLQANGSGKVLLSKAAYAVIPPTGASFAGTLARDSAGDLWYSPASGVYQKLNSPSGKFFPLTPGRVYDSRQTLPSPGPLAAGANRTISVADRRDALLNTGAVVEANFVPAGAVAVSANVTITGTVGGGFLTVNPGGNTTVGASTINWKADNQDIANGIILALNANRELTIVAGGGGSTGFIIDINGYYL